MIHWHVGDNPRDCAPTLTPACFGADSDNAAIEWMMNLMDALGGNVTTGIGMEFLHYAIEVSGKIRTGEPIAGMFEVDGHRYWVQPVELEKECST